MVQAKPGTYKARLTAGGRSQTQTFGLRMNPNETWTQADADARFKLWWRVRTITERANKRIIASMQDAKEAGEGSELAKRAAVFSGKLVPMGANLSQIANEPAKLLTHLTIIHWMLFHSEGRPTKSAYEVVNQLEKAIDAEIAAWKTFKASVGK